MNQDKRTGKLSGPQFISQALRFCGWLFKAREPVNAYSHFLGAILSAVGLFYLLKHTPFGAGPRYYVGLSIFGASLLLLYFTSGLYHKVNGSQKLISFMRRLDHIMIYILIAGTYTPICLLVLEGSWRWSMLICIWSLALLGIVFKLVWFSAPRWLSTASYVLVGWTAAVSFYPLSRALSLAGMISMVLGGIFYSAGALIYALKRPRLNLRFISFHEIFHGFVLAGSFTHYLMIYQLL